MKPESTLSSLQDELLARVCHTVGISAMLPSIGASLRIHHAWQSTVKSLDTNACSISDKDLEIIKKFTNLQRLALRNFPNNSDAIPTWQTLTILAPSLRHLTSLKVHGGDAFDALKSLAASEGLKSSLQELRISDSNYEMTAADIRALGALNSLSILHLRCLSLPNTTALQRASANLITLRQLHLRTAACLPSSVAASIPGKLTRLTSLHLAAFGNQRAPELLQEQALMAAVPSLTNLQQLHTNYFLVGPNLQLECLEPLAGLTKLHLQNGTHDLMFMPLAELTRLVELTIDRLHSDGDVVFTHPALTRLEAYGLEVDNGWQGRVAEGCMLRELVLHSKGVLDVSLANIPTLPQLQALRIRGSTGDPALHACHCRYLYLANLLHRHAATLQTIELGLVAAFEEVLPPALPACRLLALVHGEAVSCGTLRSLALCRLPVLEELQLCGAWGVAAARVEELQWLGRLCTLKTLTMLGGFCQGVLSGVKSMFQGTQVECVFEGDEDD